MTSTIRSLGANNLHNRITYNPKRIFGTSVSPTSESEVLEPEVLEHRIGPEIAPEAKHGAQGDLLWQSHAQSWGRGVRWGHSQQW